MQIELMGSTGAGKSTLARRILEAGHERGIDVWLGEDFILEQVRLNWIKSDLLRKLMVNLVALFAALVTWPANLEFYRFVARFLFRLSTSQLERLHTQRNVLKRIGIYEIVRSRSTDQQVILLDEGVLQTAHYLFVHVAAEVEADYVSVFAGLIPLPDIIVYVRQPEAVLINRTMKRGHPRIPDRSYDNTARFIKRAIATFDQLADYPAVENRLLVIDEDMQVRIAAGDPDKPTMDRTLELVQSALAQGTSQTPVERPRTPGRRTLPASPSSLLEKGS